MVGIDQTCATVLPAASLPIPAPDRICFGQFDGVGDAVFSFQFLREFAVRFQRNHLRQQSFRGYILFIRPGDSTEQDTNLIEVMDISEFLKNSAMQVGLQVEYTFPVIFQFNVNTIIFKRLNYFYIPVHNILQWSNFVWIFIADRQFPVGHQLVTAKLDPSLHHFLKFTYCVGATASRPYCPW